MQFQLVQKPCLFTELFGIATRDYAVVQAWWMKWKMGKKGPLESIESGNRGQAGFTPNERRRFKALREAAGLHDPFRLLHGKDIVGKKVRIQFWL